MPTTATYKVSFPIPNGGPYPLLTQMVVDNTPKAFVPFKSTDPSLTSALLAFFNSLGFGLFTISNDGTTVTIRTQNNTHSFQTITLNDATDYNWEIEDVVVNPEIPGCMDPTALNYNPAATVDNGTCIFNNKRVGCTDIKAKNYDPDAEVDDGTCEYERTDEEKMRCCFVQVAFEIAYKRNMGEKIPCCLEKKLKYLRGVVSVLDSYIEPGEIIGYTTTLSQAATPFPHYTENVASDSAYDIFFYQADGHGQWPFPTAFFGNMTIRSFIQKVDGTETEETGSLTGTYATTADIVDGILDLVGLNAGANPDGVHPIKSQYLITSDGGDAQRFVFVTQLTVPNNLRSGNNNSGAFRDGRVVRFKIEKNYTSAVKDFAASFTADANDGIIPCSGQPNAGIVEGPLTACPGGVVALVATGVSTSTGLTYQWQESADDVTYTDIPGENTLNLNIAVGAPKYIRLLTFCGGSFQTNNTPPVIVAEFLAAIPFADYQFPATEGNNLQLFGNNNQTGQENGASTYAWTGPNNFTSIAQNPVIGNAQQINAGDYTVVVTNAGGCSDVATTTVQVLPVMTLQISIAPTDTTFTVIAVNGVPVLNFTIDGGVTIQNDGAFTGLTPNTAYTVQCQDNNGQTASLVVTTLP